MPYAAATATRLTNYEAALAAARERLNHTDIALQSSRLGGEVEARPGGARTASITCMGTTHHVDLPGGAVTREDGQSVPVFTEILILHALIMHTGRMPAGEWIAFSDIRDGLLYRSVYEKRTAGRLAKALSGRAERLAIAAGRLGGHGAALGGDASAIVEPFRDVPIGIIFWAGDDDFTPAVTFLYDRTISDIFPAEDVVVLTQWLTEAMIHILTESAP